MTTYKPNKGRKREYLSRHYLQEREDKTNKNGHIETLTKDLYFTDPGSHLHIKTIHNGLTEPIPDTVTHKTNRYIFSQIKRYQTGYLIQSFENLKTVRVSILYYRDTSKLNDLH